MHVDGTEYYSNSGVRTATGRLAQASANRDSGRSDDVRDVSLLHEGASRLTEAQRRTCEIIGGERGEALRRTLSDAANLLQGARTDANRSAAAMRFDVQEYLSLLEGRFAGDFKSIGRQLGRLIRANMKRRKSDIRELRV